MDSLVWLNVIPTSPLRETRRGTVSNGGLVGLVESAFRRVPSGRPVGERLWVEQAKKKAILSGPPL
jgi:hypothetical protein